MKTIGIIALSGNVEEEKLNKAVKNIQELGFNVKLSENILDEKRYLAGSDEIKLQEIYNFFKNPEIDMVLCARGGYGALRLLCDIDYEIIKNNPKPIIGYSDVTAILLMVYKRTGLITYHGPMACSDFVYNNSDSQRFTLDSFFQALNDEVLNFYGNNTYFNGVAEGIIWGGNLSTVVSLCGIDFIPDEDFLFFTEDLNEQVYKIDKMFTQLFNIEMFRKHCKGIILGDFINVDNEKWLDEYFSELAEKIQVPIASGFKISHDKDKVTIPIGKKARLSGAELKVWN